MNEYTAFAVVAVAIFATAGFICWLHARYPAVERRAREQRLQVDDNASTARKNSAERQH